MLCLIEHEPYYISYAIRIIAVLWAAAGSCTVKVPAVDATVPPKLITAIALFELDVLYIRAPDADIVALVHDTSSKSTYATSLVSSTVTATFANVTPPVVYPLPFATSSVVDAVSSE